MLSRNRLLQSPAGGAHAPKFAAAHPIHIGTLWVMKWLGLLGGVTSVSTGEYYKHLNRIVNERLGGAEAAQLLIYSLNFGDCVRNNEAGRQDQNVLLLEDGVRRLERAGAEALIVCANTMHQHLPQLRKMTSVPFLDLVELVGLEIQKRKLKKVLLLGTKYTMTLPFYREQLARMGIEVMVPSTADQDMIHSSIYHEFARNIFSEERRVAYEDVILRGQAQGAEGVILGCTEIPILFEKRELSIEKLDTTLIHCQAGADFLLS